MSLLRIFRNQNIFLLDPIISKFSFIELINFFKPIKSTDNL